MRITDNDDIWNNHHLKVISKRPRDIPYIALTCMCQIVSTSLAIVISIFRTGLCILMGIRRVLLVSIQSGLSRSHGMAHDMHMRKRYGADSNGVACGLRSPCYGNIRSRFGGLIFLFIACSRNRLRKSLLHIC